MGLINEVPSEQARSAQKEVAGYGHIRHPRTRQLDQENRLATCAHDLRAVGEKTCPALRAARLIVAAVGELERTDPLDEAIRLVFIRLPADVVVQRAVHPRSQRIVDLAAHGQPLLTLLDFLVTGELAVLIDLLVGPSL
jgi:hypothetical protein